MKTIHTIAELEESILLLEAQQTNEEVLLKEQFIVTYKSLKPISIIKNTLEGLTNLADFSGSITDTSLSLAAGYVSKKLIFGSTNNPFKQIMGSLVQVGVTSLVANNADNIKAFVAAIATRFQKKQDELS